MWAEVEGPAKAAGAGCFFCGYAGLRAGCRCCVGHYSTTRCVTAVLGAAAASRHDDHLGTTRRMAFACLSGWRSWLLCRVYPPQWVRWGCAGGIDGRQESSAPWLQPFHPGRCTGRPCWSGSNTMFASWKSGMAGCAGCQLYLLLFFLVGLRGLHFVCGEWRGRWYCVGGRAHLYFCSGVPYGKKILPLRAVLARYRAFL